MPNDNEELIRLAGETKSAVSELSTRMTRLETAITELSGAVAMLLSRSQSNKKKLPTLPNGFKAS